MFPFAIKFFCLAVLLWVQQMAEVWKRFVLIKVDILWCYDRGAIAHRVGHLQVRCSAKSSLCES